MKRFVGLLLSLILLCGFSFSGKSQDIKNDSTVLDSVSATLDSAIVILDSASVINESNISEIMEKVVEIIEFRNEEEFNQMAKEGIDLFNGTKRLENGGPSCISCHVLNFQGVEDGGLLGIDLSNSYTNVNKEKGLQTILKTPTSPIMKITYANSAITPEEMKKLIALLKKADLNKNYQVISTNMVFLLEYSVFGVVIIMLVMLLIWRKRIKKSVKHDIYKRQLKTT